MEDSRLVVMQVDERSDEGIVHGSISARWKVAGVRFEPEVHAVYFDVSYEATGCHARRDRHQISRSTISSGAIGNKTHRFFRKYNGGIRCD